MAGTAIQGSGHQVHWDSATASTGKLPVSIGKISQSARQLSVLLLRTRFGGRSRSGFQWQGVCHVRLRTVFTALYIRLDALLNRCVVRPLQRLAEPGTDGVQIHLGHAAGQQRLLLQQRLALESTLPEPPLAAILLVRVPGNILVETAHVPTDIRQRSCHRPIISRALSASASVPNCPAVTVRRASD